MQVCIGTALTHGRLSLNVWTRAESLAGASQIPNIQDAKYMDMPGMRAEGRLACRLPVGVMFCTCFTWIMWLIEGQRVRMCGNRVFCEGRVPVTTSPSTARHRGTYRSLDPSSCENHNGFKTPSQHVVSCERYGNQGAKITLFCRNICCVRAYSTSKTLVYMCVTSCGHACGRYSLGQWWQLRGQLGCSVRTPRAATLQPSGVTSLSNANYTWAGNYRPRTLQLYATCLCV